MIDKILNIGAPHYCSGCGVIGSILCESCANDIINESFSGCVSCTKLAHSDGICTQCNPAYSKAWAASSYDGTIKALIHDYKIGLVREAGDRVADLLDSTLPALPRDVVLVPVPTVPAHVRVRGFDHAKHITKRLGRKRKAPVRQLISRKLFVQQRGTDRVHRFAQASRSFTVAKRLNSNHIYVVIDDVVTTGATLHYAAQALRNAGAQTVWVAAIARKVLD